MALFGAAGSVVSRALVELDIDAHQFDRKLDEADARLREHGNTVGKTLKAGYLAGAAGVAVLTGAIVKSTEVAVEAQQVRAREQAQLKALDISYTAHRKEIDANILALSRLSGFTGTELTDSFTRLVAVTHNVAGANHDLAIAVDVARARHISLEAATQLVTKASIGQVGALRRMGINIAAVHDAQNKLTAEHIKASPALRQQAKDLDTVATANKALALLQSRYAGQAKAYGQTTAGEFARMHAAAHELEDEVGSALLPQLARLAEWLTKLIQRLQDSRRAHEDLHKAIRAVETVVHNLVGVLKVAWDLLSTGVHLIGGVKNALVVLLAAMAIGKVSSFFGAMIGGWKTAGREAVISSQMAQGASREEAAAYLAAMGEMEVATVGLSATIKSALISTGIGALIVAAGIAATLIISHWNTVKKWLVEFGDWIDRHWKAIIFVAPVVVAVVEIIKHWKTVKHWFAEFWKWLETTALNTARAIVEPFSHLPGRLGGWARKAKQSIDDELWNLEGKAAADAGAKAGAQFGAQLNAAMAPFLSQAQMTASAALTGAAGGLNTGGAAGSPGSKGNSVRGGYSKGVASFAQAGIVSTARSQIGIAYKLGGPAQLGKHTDCSGLAIAVLRQNGITVSGRTTWDLVKQGTPTTWSGLQAGDLVFFSIPEDGGTPPQHVGIYIGNGQMIHDPHTGASVEQVDLDTSYWRSRFYAARRYVKTGQAGGGGGGTGGATGTPGSDAGNRGTNTGASAGSTAAFNAAAAAAPRSGKKTATPAGNKIAGIPAVDSVKRSLARDYGDLSTLHAAGLDAIVKKIRPEMDKIKGELGRPITNKELGLVRNQLANLGSTINAGLTKAKAIIASRRSEFERAWADFANKAMTAFDRVTQQHVAKMQADTAKAIQQLSVTVNGPNGAFQYASGALTPAQQALQDLQDARDEADRQASITDARKQLAGAATEQDKADAQKALDDALYQEKVANLQKTADAEQKAADAALQAAQDNAQTIADQQLQDYEDQRQIQRDALQQQLDDLEAHLEARKAKFSDANDVLAKLMADGGANVGTAFVQALKDSLAAAGLDLSTYLGAAGGAGAKTATAPKVTRSSGSKAVGLTDTTSSAHVTVEQHFHDDRPAEAAALAARYAAGRVWAT